MMADPFEVCTSEQQPIVVRSLCNEGEPSADICRRMKKQCGDTCVLIQQIYEWHGKFKSAVSNLTEAADSDWPHTANNPDANVKWNECTGKPVGNNGRGS